MLCPSGPARRVQVTQDSQRLLSTVEVFRAAATTYITCVVQGGRGPTQPPAIDSFISLHWDRNSQ
jgi:hypothetical protein